VVDKGSLSLYPCSTPKVSVILLVQPSAPPPGEVIANIQTQTLADWELIIVANGVAASSQAALERYTQQDERIQMEVCRNLSLTQARQVGFERAQGKYIYCLDGSYLSEPNTLQRLYEALETQPAAVAAYGAMAGMKRSAKPLDILAQLIKEHFLSRGAVAIRRALLLEVLALTDSVLEDQALWWLLTTESIVTYVGDDPLGTPNPALSMRRVLATNGAYATDEPRPVKLAYLIVAHYQPNHLARLIQTLNDESSYFFIHIDGKVPLAPFQALVPQHANIVFLPNRVEVQWSKLSVVQAMLKLIQAAVASGHAFKYYTVLSGSDYPIKHKQEIYTWLQTSDCQYLRIDRKLTNEANNSHRQFIKRLPQGKYFGDLTPYHGSMYWSLTADCIRFILDFVHNNPDYVAIHQHIFAPDEVFFHTIVKHSPFASAITHDFSDGIYPDHTHHGNHFIDWAGLRRRAYLTLDERDFADLLASTALFARKFDERKSGKLLDLLDMHIHFSCVGENVES